MQPTVTAAAAALADCLVIEAFTAISTLHSPPDRIALSIQTARLPIRDGGLGLASFTTSASAAFVTSFLATWPTCCRICPALHVLAAPLAPGAPSLLLPYPSSIAAFSAAYASLLATAALVRHTNASLASVSRTWVDGTVHSGFHPPLPAAAARLPSLADQLRRFATPVNTTTPRVSSRTFTAVASCASWHACMAATHAFDTANSHLATVPHREATRLLSCSQPDAGAWLSRTPDISISHSHVHSRKFTTAIQRRLGLYISATVSALTFAGTLASQHDLLGDSVINAANHTHRHNAGLSALYTAVLAASSTTVSLGDKGDGTRGSRDTSTSRHAHLNSTHIPDLISGTTLWEFKAITPFHPTPALGHGSTRNGGAPSEADGHFIAHGNTLESITRLTRGLVAHGTPSDPPLDRVTGHGRVAAVAGHYADAIIKKNPLILFLVETTGALSLEARAAIAYLHRLTKPRCARDGTQYGTARGATTSFRRHHTAAISSAVILADAETLLRRGDRSLA